MKRLRLRLLCSALTLASCVNAAAAAAQEAGGGGTAAASSRVEEEILIIGQRINRTSSGATGLPLTLMETPQAVTVIDRTFIQDFGLDTINEVLDLTTGVKVEEVETNRTYYISRGFDIKAMQVDGTGMPFNWNVVGDLDTAIYDKVEVIRGANGMLTGTGNPSGTINFVRKRPTNEFAAAGEISIGSWNKRRIEADVSSPLTRSGRWAGRLVAAAQESDSHLNLNESDRTIFYGAIDGQMGDKAILTFGYTQQDEHSKAVLWGALPLLYTDGTQTSYDTSATTTMDWTFWDTHSKTGFVELTYALPGDWEVKGVATYQDYDEPSELFYVYGNPDPETGLGLFGYPGAFSDQSKRFLVDVTAAGTYPLLGRRHDLFLGINVSGEDHLAYQSAAPFDDPAWGALPAFPGWTGREISRPAFQPRTESANWETEQRRVYGATQVKATDALNLVLGFNWIDVETTGVSYAESMDRAERQFSPYVGFTYAVMPNVNLYASYSNIYEPQAQLDQAGRQLGAAEGKSYEVGAKAEWFDRRLFTTGAWFKAEQQNYAESGGFDPDTGRTYYTGNDYESDGFELEIAGMAAEGLLVQAGYSSVDIQGPDGENARTFVPQHSVNLGLRYTVPALTGVEMGATLKWQDDIQIDAALGQIRQDAYALMSLYASYQITDQVEVGVNVNNVTDEKYLSSLYWDQAYYGPSRNVLARLRVAY